MMIIGTSRMRCEVLSLSPNPRENFPISYSRCRTLETLWDNTESIRHVAVSSNDDSKPPELIFNRLQVSDEEYIDMQRRSFGRYIAREAVLNEEYWVCFLPIIT
uniref:Acyl-CoA N-acyltransferase n=1 Tax=Tanacetum cinerariifolium TaxID=118510 RepID=A0A6L2LHC4_TANCI|nr:acyl-CoA N-acyltransferase [Tanacetum cinerariifolium]